MENLSSIASLLQEVRAKKPLVHHITNYVTVNDCANVTLAIGASPVMADDIGEAEDIVQISSALVINMGTLNERTISSMIAAGKKANLLNVPVVFDPVGVGASRLRNETAKVILEQVKCAVIRGNISEIRFITGLQSSTKGVDASEADMKDADTAGSIARSCAKKYSAVAAITGATDVISDGNITYCIENGHEMLGGITGTGCMCTSLVGSFCGVTDNYLFAACAGIITMGIAGETAFEKAGTVGAGTFHQAIFDGINNLTINAVIERARIYERKD